MTTVYFVRHAEADNTIRDGQTRPLTAKGMNDRALVTSFLLDKNNEAMGCTDGFQRGQMYWYGKNRFI